MVQRYFMPIFLFVVCLINVGFCNFANANNKGKPLLPVLVEAAKVRQQAFGKQITVMGSLRANQGIVLRPEVAGHITKIYFKSGDMVSEGAPIVQLNDNVIQAQLQQAQALLGFAEQGYQRMAKLYQTHTISSADFDDVVSKLNAARAKVKEYQANLSQTLLVAPFAGKLGLSAVSLGDYIKVGQDIVSLEAIDPIEVEFNLPQIYLSKVFVGQAIKIFADTYVGKVFMGNIYAIDSVVNLNNRSFAVRAVIPNKDSKLLPGTFVEVNLDFTDKNLSFVIPQVAVFYEEGQNYVYKIIDGKRVIKTRITLGERDKENIVVLSGLSINDTVVTAGQLNLEDGANVKVVQ